MLKWYVWAKMLLDDSGQDLIEYALIAALIAFAAVAGMGGLAIKINSSFNTIGNKLTNSMGT